MAKRRKTTNAATALTVGSVSYHGQQFLPPPGETLSGLIVKSMLWIAAILVVFVPIAVRTYRKTT